MSYNIIPGVTDTGINDSADDRGVATRQTTAEAFAATGARITAHVEGHWSVEGPSVAAILASCKILDTALAASAEAEAAGTTCEGFGCDDCPCAECDAFEVIYRARVALPEDEPEHVGHTADDPSSCAVDACRDCYAEYNGD